MFLFTETWDIESHTIPNTLWTESSDELFVCDNGEVILRRFMCDGKSTCVDGSAEVECGN